MCIYVYVYMYMCVCMYVCVFVCMYVCMYVCLCVCLRLKSRPPVHRSSRAAACFLKVFLILADPISRAL